MERHVNGLQKPGSNGWGLVPTSLEEPKPEAPRLRPPQTPHGTARIHVLLVSHYRHDDAGGRHAAGQASRPPETP